MPNPRKKSSKRVPLARRYNIHVKAKEQERKMRRAAKKNPSLRKKLRKDLGIPNLNPFKAEILKKLEETQKRIKFVESQRAKREQQFAAKRRAGADAEELAAMAAQAAARGDEYEQSAAAHARAADGTLDVHVNAHAGESTRRAFYRHVKQLLEKADVILEVLDARDPLSCRAPAIEALALAQDPPKRIVLVLNKIDLVPPEVVRQWLTYLRREFPAVAFKASTQNQRDHLAAPVGAAVNKATEAGEVVTGSGAAGTDTLLQLIKNYSRSKDMKRAVTVGVVGYPNVGKSSVINSLKRSSAMGVSSTPGFTKTLQETRLDSKITLIDCPGIIFDDDAGSTSRDDGGAGLLLKNCISVDTVEDPEAAVDGILQRCAPEKLVALYGIGIYDSTPDFLAQVAVKRGKLGKGGVPDKLTAARLVLQDWNSGRIPFFVLPPVDEIDEMEDERLDSEAAAAPAAKGSMRGTADGMGAVSFVTEWGKEFDFESILKAEDAMLEAEAAQRGIAGAVGVASAANSRFARSKHAIRATSADAMSAAATFIAETRGDEDDEGSADDDDSLDEDEEEEEEEEEVPAPAAGRSRSGSRGASAAGATKHVGKKSVTFAASAKPAKSAKAAGKGAQKSKGRAADDYDFRQHFK